jgi:hypothetical protein
LHKIGEQEGRTDPAKGFDTSGTREEVGEGCRRVNIVQYCVRVYVNEKMIPLQLFQEWGGEEPDEGKRKRG